MITRGLLLLLLTGCVGADEEFVTEPAVVINEATSSGDDRIELVNRSDEPIDISGWAIQDSDRTSKKTYLVTAGSVLQPAARVVLFKGVHHDFGLGDEDAVVLLDAAGQVVDQAEWPPGEADISWCRIPDGTGDFTACTVQTFGEPNPAEPHFDGAVVPPIAVLRSPDSTPLEPDELGFDAEGRIWVGDPQSERLLVYDDGMVVAGIEGFAGGTHAVRAGPTGEVYVTDRGRQQVSVYDPATLELTRVLTHEAFEDPKGLAITADGTVYVSDQGTGAIHVFDAAGAHLATWPRLTETVVDKDGALCEIPCGAETLALDEAADRLYVTSANAGRIEVYALSTGTWLQQHVGEPQSGAAPEPGRFRDEVEGLAVDVERGLLFAVDEHNGRIVAYDLSDPDALVDPARDFGTIGAFGRIGDAPGELYGADGLAVDAAGQRLAVADQENERVQVFEVTTVLETLGR